MSELTLWVTAQGAGHSQWYIERFRRMAAEGVDLGGEARLLHQPQRRAAVRLAPGASHTMVATLELDTDLVRRSSQT